MRQKNSRPHENLELRHDYAESEPNCELWPLLKACDTPAAQDFLKRYIFSPHECFGVHTHHIISVGSRPDVWSNLVRACFVCHAFCHQYPQQGRILCLYVKRRKAGPDWNPVELSASWGQSVTAWVARNTCDWPDIEKLRMELLDGFRCEGCGSSGELEETNTGVVCPECVGAVE